MSQFKYIRANNLDEAITFLNEPDIRSKVLAGGTDLLVQAHQRLISVDHVVDVTQIAELKTIQADKRITIGAGVTFSELLKSPIVQNQVPLLAKACSYIGSVQIRNRGTIGGNVANAALSADTLPILVCLEAEAIIATPDGDKRIRVTDLVTRPHQTKLKPGELIKAFVFDPLPPGSKYAFERIGRRRAMVISRLSLAAIGVRNAEGKTSLIRLVPGSAFPWFRRIKVVEDMLIGQAPTEELISQAGHKMAECFMDVSGNRWSSPYKQQALAAITERALRQVLREVEEEK